MTRDLLADPDFADAGAGASAWTAGTAPGIASKLSGLDAAAKILAEAKKPMTCKVIVAEAFKRNRDDARRQVLQSELATEEGALAAA